MDRLAKCIDNNHALYQAVFERPGKEYTRNDSIWYSPEKPPPLYSNIVTRSPEWRLDEIFQGIDKRFEAEGWDEWTIKDSFGVLDLRPYGFTKLFDAQWIYLDRSTFKSIPEYSKLKWKTVQTTKELEEWLLAWDSDASLGKQIFTPQMLDDAAIKFIAGYENDKLTTGCLLNASDDVHGISNFFAPAPQISYWYRMIKFVIEQTGTDLVGYARDAGDWTTLGFEPQGPLTVWIKRHSSLFPG